MIDRVRAGDPDAYGVLVRRYGPIALRAAVAMGAGADAEDVVQESFVKAYRALGRFRTGSAFRPWLLAIVSNETRNLQRSAVRRATREQADSAEPPRTDEGDDPAETVLAAERATALQRGLAELNAGQRDVLTCRYLLELDEQETAAMLGLSRGTVKSRTSRGLRALRNVMADAGLPSMTGGDDS